MKRLLLLVLILPGIFFHPTNDLQAQPVSLSLASSLQLSDAALVGEVSSVDRASDGRLVIVDRISNSVFVFAPDGRLLAELDPGACGIHHRFRPIYARFSKSEIIVVNSDPWGIRFNSEGRCVGLLDVQFQAPADLRVAIDGTLYGYYPWDRKVVVFEPSGSIRAEVELSNIAFPNAVARIEGGGIALLDGQLFVAPSVGDEVAIVNTRNRRIDRVSLREVGITIPPSDLREGAPEEVLGQAPYFLRSTSIIMLLAEAIPGTLLVQYQNPDRTLGLAILDRTGSVTHHYGRIAHRLLYAGNGVAISAYQPDVDAVGRLPNPILHFYDLSR